MAAGKIDDLHFRDNETRLQWIGESDWIYSRKFEVSRDLLNHQYVELHCEGLDTLAEIQINGIEVARTDNMFRRSRIDIGNILRPGINSISIKK